MIGRAWRWYIGRIMRPVGNCGEGPPPEADPVRKAVDRHTAGAVAAMVGPDVAEGLSTEGWPRLCTPPGDILAPVASGVVQSRVVEAHTTPPVPDPRDTGEHLRDEED